MIIVHAPCPPLLLRVFLPLLLLAVAGSAPAATAPAPAELARRLAALAPGTLLRIRLDDGAMHEGRFAAVTADSLTLVVVGGIPLRCPLATVVDVRRDGGGAGGGWRTGTRLGAVLGVAAGLLGAAFIDAIEEGEGETLTVGYAAAAVGTATAGAVACGGLGAALAAGSRRWQDLPPVRPRRQQRLLLQAGLAAADGLATNVQGPCLRGWLPRRVSAVLDAGPEVAWSGLGDSQSSWTGETASWGDTWLLGLAARLAPAAPGLQPFASVGLGWYKREDSLLGLSLGAGLRWHRADGGGLDWELRWHSSPSGSEDVPPHGQWTVAAGWTFAI